MKTARIAAALVAILVMAPVGARAATLSRDAGVTIVTQNDPDSLLAGVELAVGAGLDRQRLDQNGLAALTAESIVRTPVDGVPLEDAIAAHGGSVRFTMQPTRVLFYVEAIPSDARAVAVLFERAIAAPDFSRATVDDARARLVHDIAAQQQEPLVVGIEMLALSQAGGQNTGLPSFGSPALLAQLAPADVAAFYRAYYRRGQASISAAGRIDAIGDDALRKLAETLPAGSTAPVETAVARLGATGERQLVTHRDISAPWLVVSYGAPPVTSRDYGPMLVLSAFLQRTLGDIAELPGTITPTIASQAVGTLYDYDAASPSLVLYVDGGVGEPNRAFGTALSVVNLLSATRLQGSIDQFKRIAIGNFAMSVESVEARARIAGVFVRRTGSADYLAATQHAIETTTPADLQRVARRYLGKPTIALVLPRASTQN